MKVAAVSCTNLKEDYIRRFTATSIVGYLFQVLSEWDVPAVDRRWSPAKTKTDKSLPFECDALIAHHELALRIAHDAKSAHDESMKLKAEAVEMDATCEDRKLVAAKYKEADKKMESYIGLLYAATHMSYKMGSDASTRLVPTAELGMNYPEVKAVLVQFPPPAAHNQMEMPMDVAKNIITSFLQSQFTFDPNTHARSGHDAKTMTAAIKKEFVGTQSVDVDAFDPSHMPLSSLRSIVKPLTEHKEMLEVITKSTQSKNAMVTILRDDELTEAALFALVNTQAFKQYLMPIAKSSPTNRAIDNLPPQDMFHRWAYYTEVNYEELRTITEALYPEKPDIDWALALWDVFEGTQSEVDDAFQKHCLRYQDEIITSIKSVGFGHWTFLGDFKENRKKIQFYNKNTEVLKRILDRHAEDKKVGAELMRNRVRQTKAKNIAEVGGDAEGLALYKQNISASSNDLASKGAEKVITMEEMRRLEKAKGSIKAARELEHLEQLEKTIADMTEIQKYRQLTAEESRDLANAKSNIGLAREMVAVPDDAIQIDVFSSDPSTGKFSKSHFYTKADNGEKLAESNN